MDIKKRYLFCVRGVVLALCLVMVVDGGYQEDESEM